MSCFAKKKLPVKSHRLLTDRQPDTRACIHMHTLTDAHAHTCKQTSTKSCQCIHVSAALLCIHSANVSSDVTKAHCVYVAPCTQIYHVECVCQHAYKVHTSVDAKIQLTLHYLSYALHFFFKYVLSQASARKRVQESNSLSDMDKLLFWAQKKDATIRTEREQAAAAEHERYELSIMSRAHSRPNE